MTWPIIAFWVVAIATMCTTRPFVVYLFFCTYAFGALAVIPTTLTGGVSLLAQPMSLLFLVAWAARRKRACRAAVSMALDVRKLGVLGAFIALAFASAFILPRLFAGQVSVYPLRTDQPGLALLAPSSSNITQILYLLMSYLAAIVFAVLWRDMTLRTTIFRALLWGGAILAASGMLDLATAGTELLAPFRTASYVFMIEDNVLGAKRAVGFMSEASSYGSGCVLFAALLYFLRNGADPASWHARFTPLVIVSLIAMAALSTSSTAFVGLAVFGLCAILNFIRRVVVERGRVPKQDMMTDAVALYLGVAALVCLFIFQKQALDTAYSFLDAIVFKKTESVSFAERSEWSRSALEAFGQTHGLGLGVGSARVSNWFVAVLTGSGVVGAGLMTLVLLQALMRRSYSGGYAGREIIAGLKFCIALSLAMAGLSATTSDFGLMVGFMLGSLAGLSETPSRATARSASNKHNQLSSA